MRTPKWSARGGWLADFSRDVGPDNRDFLDLEILVEQVVGVDDQIRAAAADGEAFLDARIDRHLEGEAVRPCAERAHRLGALVQARKNHSRAKCCPILITADDAERDVRAERCRSRRLDV